MLYVCGMQNEKTHTMKAQNTQNQQVMINLSKTITAKEVRNLNLNENDTLGYEFFRDDKENFFLLINGNRSLNFTAPSDRRKSFDKIKRMGFGLGWLKPQLTDEERGLIAAGSRGVKFPKALALYK